MFAKLSPFALLAASIPSTLATLFVTQPVATTVWPVGTTVTVQWQDNGVAPALASYSVCDVGLYAGSVTAQTLLQSIGTLDVSTANSLDFQIHSDIGPNEQAYFVRFTSTTLKDTTNTQYPAQAFSAIFAVSGATGTFNSTVQAQVAAQPGASGASSVASSTAASTAQSSATKAASATASTTAKSNSTAQAASSSSGSAVSMSVSGFLAAGFFTAFSSLLFL
ncbi:hypothetical protein OF83DRAFT_1124387 [Amylostereum chailletii]|nr:hypothetical protein OF83DRAFT_1124387 [Amylostereum chailletii]